MISDPPRVSVIIAAYNIENFIEAAVHSVLGQSVPFHEVIVVDDCSTDRTRDIIRRLAGESAAIVPVLNEHNVGLGPVRNIGTQTATGDYICYLDGDDLFTPDAHEVMQKALAKRPDIIMLNHARLYDTGHIVPNYNAHLLAPATHRSVVARKMLFENLNVAWNKVYARSFLDRTGLTFPEGKYEDIGWNFMALMQADRIVTRPEVVIKYRQRDGSILRARNTTHFDLFDRWDELFTALDDHPDLRATYGPILRITRFKSLRTVLENKYRLPASAKAAFARRMVQVCGPIKDLPASQIGRIERLLDLPGGYWLRWPFRTKTYLKLHAAMGPSVQKLRPFSRLPKRAVYHALLLHLPVRPDLVVYQSYWGAKVACNPYAIYQHLQKTAPNRFDHVWITKDGVDPRDTKGHAQHLREHSWAYYYTLARAGTLINNANFPNEVIKRPGTVHLQTKHGTPLKYMGLDQLKTDPFAWPDPQAFVARCTRWDYVISSNSYSSQVWRQGFPYSYRILETGYPRNDRLITADDAERAQMRKRLGLPDDKQVVLYAPTFRPDYPGGSPTQPGKEEIIAAIMAGLGPDQMLAIRDHYFLDKGSRFEGDARVVDLSGHVSTTDVLLVTDLLITDYSSIMFDFAVQKRPIVILAQDKDLYAAARGTYFDIARLHPGTFCTTLPDLTRALDTRAYDSEAARAQARNFHAVFCHLDDGHAARRVCDVLFRNLVPSTVSEED